MEIVVMKDDSFGLQKSLVEVAKLDRAHSNVCNEAGKVLRKLGLTKPSIGIPFEDNTLGITSRRAYHPELFSAYMLSITVSASVGLHTPESSNWTEKIFPVNLADSTKLYALDNFELYLRGRWISYSEQLRVATHSKNLTHKLIILDNGLFLSQRNMPQTNDVEVLHFFEKTMKPANSAWNKLITMAEPPVVVGINSFIRSKLTRAVVNGYSLEPVTKDMVSYLSGLLEDNPWMGEGALMLALLNKPGMRSILYRLSKEQLGNTAPSSLIESGGVVSSYIRTNRGIFQIEIPYYLFQNDITKYERIVSQIAWLTDFQNQEIPTPLSYARAACTQKQLPQSLDGLIRMTRRMNRKHE